MVKKTLEHEFHKNFGAWVSQKFWSISFIKKKLEHEFHKNFGAWVSYSYSKACSWWESICNIHIL
jgi:hypothetical protein